MFQMIYKTKMLVTDWLNDWIAILNKKLEACQRKGNRLGERVWLLYWELTPDHLTLISSGQEQQDEAEERRGEEGGEVHGEAGHWAAEDGRGRKSMWYHVMADII